MFTSSLSSARTILCLGAHSDDIEIGCGGTVLRLLAEIPGISVTWVVFSAREQLEHEGRDAANRFLANAADTQLLFFDHRDAYLPYSGEQIKTQFHEIRKLTNPDIVFTHRLEDRHQDHRLIAELTWNTFRNHTIYEYEIPKYDGDLAQPNVFVKLDQKYVDQKIEILLESFKSQSGKHWFDRETFQSLMRIRGLESAAINRYAEAFHARKIIIS